MDKNVENVALVRCPVGFSEKIIAVFQLIKKSQIDTENDKSPKNVHSSKFLRIFRQILDRLFRLESFKGSTRKGWLSSSRFRRVYCIFKISTLAGILSKSENVYFFQYNFWDDTE